MRPEGPLVSTSLQEERVDLTCQSADRSSSSHFGGGSRSEAAIAFIDAAIPFCRTEVAATARHSVRVVRRAH